MSMTQEQALKLLERPIYKWSMDWDEREDGLNYTEAIEIAIAALRPVSREQVERMRGEWTTDGVCSRCGFDAMYYKGVPVQVRTNYCPACGSPMTDKAVEMVMKRMEEMKNG